MVIATMKLSPTWTFENCLYFSLSSFCGVQVNSDGGCLVEVLEAELSSSGDDHAHSFPSTSILAEVVSLRNTLANGTSNTSGL